MPPPTPPLAYVDKNILSRFIDKSRRIIEKKTQKRYNIHEHQITKDLWLNRKRFERKTSDFELQNKNHNMKFALYFQKFLKALISLTRFHRSKLLPKDQFGKNGENKAALFLKSEGYNILDRNVRFSIGEIDIVAQNEKYIVIIEVKTRRSAEYCHPIEAVHKKKREKIKKMGWRYYRNKKYATKGFAMRFDIITILWPGWPENKLPTIEHFVDAFR